MTSAIGDHTERDAGRTEPPPAKSGAEIVIAHDKTSARSAAGNAENQIGWPQLAEGPGPLTAAGTLRVLIVEDDLAIGPLLAEVFEVLGHFVCAIETDAGAAVAAARRYRPDLIIVDVRLGTTSGLSAVNEILEQGLVPHVFVTGDAVRSLPLGPEAVPVQKPYRASDLVTAIAKATARRPTAEQSSRFLAFEAK